MARESEKSEKPETLTVSVPEAGRRLGLGRDASYAAAARGEIPTLQFGKLLRCPVAALDQMLATGVQPSKQK